MGRGHIHKVVKAMPKEIKGDDVGVVCGCYRQTLQINRSDYDEVHVRRQAYTAIIMGQELKSRIVRAPDSGDTLSEIGRASCRERVLNLV